MIFLDQNNLDRAEELEVAHVIRSGEIATNSPMVDEVEEILKGLIGKHGAATNSGTAALHLALLEAGVGREDEVILPAISYVATLNVVKYVGAIPVFVDVDPRTWCMDVNQLERTITQKTKAIIPVHLYGNVCEMDAIMQILPTDKKIWVIEDACQALGSMFMNKMAGTFGDFGCFSFNNNKVITAGGGGFVVGNEDNINHIRKVSQQAKPDFDELGYNYRMTGLSAALLKMQLRKLGGFIAKKRMFNEIYKQELSDLICFQAPTVDSKPNWWYSAGRLDRQDISNCRYKLQRQGVQTREVFRPLIPEPWSLDEFPNALDKYYFGLCLPVSTVNNSYDIYRACEIVRRELGAQVNLSKGGESLLGEGR